LPIKPLCSTICKGIAAMVSGSKKSVDPRLAKLKSFKSLGG
jgi:uncharacterized metal-binding protein YceD (DUF177 family)